MQNVLRLAQSDKELLHEDGHGDLGEGQELLLPHLVGRWAQRDWQIDIDARVLQDWNEFLERWAHLTH